MTFRLITHLYEGGADRKRTKWYRYKRPQYRTFLAKRANAKQFNSLDEAAY